MYLLAVVAALRPETVSANSSQTRRALQVGTPSAWEEGFGTRYGPPLNVTGPLPSVSVPLGGVIVAKAKKPQKAEPATRAQAVRIRRCDKPERATEYFFIRDSFRSPKRRRGWHY